MIMVAVSVIRSSIDCVGVSLLYFLLPRIDKNAVMLEGLRKIERKKI